MTDASVFVITPHKIIYNGIINTLNLETINLNFIWVEDYLCLLNFLHKSDISIFIIDCTGKHQDYLEVITVIKGKIPSANILSIIEDQNADTETKLLSMGTRGIITENIGINL